MVGPHQSRLPYVDRSTDQVAIQQQKIEMDSRNFLFAPHHMLIGTKKVHERPSAGVDAGSWQQPLPNAASAGEPTRVYHVWPGNNVNSFTFCLFMGIIPCLFASILNLVFFFKGMLICGPDPRGFLFTMTSIILSNWIFCAYIADELPNHASQITAFCVILMVMVLVNLLLVATRDPGIIPRNDHPPIEEVGSSCRIRSKSILFNGVEMKLKYCRICMLFRPPRSCHCAICDNCVERFDHHCPWIGQCIGLRNYRYYVMFICSASGFFMYIFVFSCWRVDQRMSETGCGIFGVLIVAPEALALAIFCFMGLLFAGGLTAYHAYLITQNQTAFESFKRCQSASPNPHDKGLGRNIKEALFSKLPPSRVDFRAQVEHHQCSNSNSRPTVIDKGRR